MKQERYSANDVLSLFLVFSEKSMLGNYNCYTSIKAEHYSRYFKNEINKI